MPLVKPKEKVVGFLCKDEDQSDEEVYCLECAIKDDIYKDGEYIEPGTKLIKDDWQVTNTTSKPRLMWSLLPMSLSESLSGG